MDHANFVHFGARNRPHNARVSSYVRASAYLSTHGSFVRSLFPAWENKGFVSVFYGGNFMNDYRAAVEYRGGY